jgi:centromere protein C
MEEVDGIFSSPEKSPVKENGFDRSDSYDGSDGMSMDEGVYFHARSRP